MSRIRMIAVGAALVLFVYLGATATDTHVGAVAAAIQTTLESEMEFEWLGEWFIGGGGPRFVEIPALVAILLLLFGGLPLAIFGLLLERQWAGAHIEQRRNMGVPYAVLMFQIVSTLLSGFMVVTLGPLVVEAIVRGWVQAASDLFLPTYLLGQTLAGIAAIPVWRRLLRSASDDRASSLRLARVSRI
jgi:hypothetical protein